MSEQSPPPPTPEGPLSPDGHYRWDGSKWQPAAGTAGVPSTKGGIATIWVVLSLIFCFPLGFIFIFFSRWTQKTKLIVAGVFGGLLLLGLISIAASPKTTTSPTASHSPSPFTSPSPRTSLSPTVPPSGHASPSPSLRAAQPSHAPLPGIGATEADWNLSHTADTQKSSGSAYNLQPSGTDYYAGVGRVGGYIDNYQIQPNPSISRDAALLAIRHEMPADAQLVLDVKFGACEKVQYQSASVAANLHKAGYYSASDTSEVVDIHLYSPGLMVYDGAHVDSMILFALNDKGDNSDDC